MKFTDTIYISRTRLNIILLLVLLISSLQMARCQEPPPRPITVTVTAQGLSFGAFSQGATGGTVTISSAGGRSATGDVILLNLTGYTFSTALYRLVGNPGTVVSILNGPNVSLPGIPGGSMTLQIGASNPASPFVINTIPPAYTELNIGGTLMVSSPAMNPPGSYSGTFDITFIQE
jgi:hypothetical protein